MGPLPFHSLLFLSSTHRGFGVVILKTTIRFIYRFVVYIPRGYLPIRHVNLWIKRLVMLQHAVDNPQDFMHTDAHRGHVVFALLLMFLVDLFDHRVTLNGHQSNHVQDPSRFFTTLFAHLDAADAVTADLVDRVYPKKGSQLFRIGEALGRLDFYD
jgi:hypothetical protein